MRAWRSGADVLRERLAGRPGAGALGAGLRAASAPRALARDAAPLGGLGETTLPDYVVDRLADLRLLHDVPFDHLVPDATLLPPESLRFFRLDAEWTDALTDGALGVGASATQERAHHEATREGAQAAVDPALRAVRDRKRGRSLPAARAGRDPPGPITGLLLRSLAVANFPGVQVRAYSGSIPADQDPDTAPDGTKLALLRLSQLAPSVLLALFDGVPSLVVLEEPHTSVQLGVTAKQGGGFSLALRAANGSVIEQQNQAVRIDVPLRQGSESLGVVDVAALAARLGQEAQARPSMPRPIGPAALALELIRAPWRQRFGSPGNV